MFKFLNLKNNLILFFYSKMSNSVDVKENIYGLSYDKFTLKNFFLNLEKKNSIFFLSNLNNILNLHKFNKLNKRQRHFFHIVTPSPWPLFGSVSTFFFLVSSVAYIHRFFFGGYYMLFGLFLLLLTMFFWWRDVIRESTWQGFHTKKVQRGLRFGFALFILSEVMFFFGIFWSFFHSSLAPAIELGSIWPPIGIEPLDTWKIPFLNTLILLMSGFTITIAHHSIIARTSKITNYSFLITILLSLLFTSFQLYEYYVATFEISDGIYGTTFFFSTGFHGFHVFIGTCFIFVCWIRFFFNHFTSKHHIGFECAAWYWHFVDIVWLFLFMSVYWWGSL